MRAPAGGLILLLRFVELGIGQHAVGILHRAQLADRIIHLRGHHENTAADKAVGYLIIALDLIGNGIRAVVEIYTLRFVDERIQRLTDVRIPLAAEHIFPIAVIILREEVDLRRAHEAVFVRVVMDDEAA